MTVKENQNQSKLEKLTYQELHQQEYFTNLKVEQFQMSKSHWKNWHMTPVCAPLYLYCLGAPIWPFVKLQS